MPEDDSPQKAPPALFEHCVRTYRVMFSEAKQVTVNETQDSADMIVVYEGFFTQLITGKLNLSVPYYTRITAALQRMGCIRQLKRGGGTSPSQWELIYEPTLEAFLTSQPKRKQSQSKDEMYLQLIDELNGRVSSLEGTVEGLLQALAEKFGTELAE